MISSVKNYLLLHEMYVGSVELKEFFCPQSTGIHTMLPTKYKNIIMLIMSAPFFAADNL